VGAVLDSTQKRRLRLAPTVDKTYKVNKKKRKYLSEFFFSFVLRVNSGKKQNWTVDGGTKT